LKGAIEEKLLEDDGREENLEVVWRKVKEKITEATDESLVKRNLARTGRK